MDELRRLLLTHTAMKDLQFEETKLLKNRGISFKAVQRLPHGKSVSVNSILLPNGALITRDTLGSNAERKLIQRLGKML